MDLINTTIFSRKLNLIKKINIIIQKINYFKSSKDYMDIRYFSFINFNKKSNQKKVIKCVIEKLK